MKPAPRRWEIQRHEPLDGLHPLLGRVLAGRGFDGRSARALFDEHATFHDPFGLRGMTEAVGTLAGAIAGGERIAVYGDYDADGVTACALLTIGLRSAGADVLPYIPNRMTDGYGLHATALEDLAAEGVGCVITVDCGTSSVDVARNRPAGMRLIITDHHLPLTPGGAAALAPCDALINPKQPGCGYEFDALCGAGVAWKLLCALEAEGLVPPGTAEAGIGLAALGTVADMMPLKGENRAIVRRGLALLDSSPPPGIGALRTIAGMSGPLRASDLAFGIAPRINAAGRMEDARLALALCLETDPAAALDLAALLNAQNLTRRQAVAVALAEAELRVEVLGDDLPAIVLGDAGWPMGIVGLVAGRIAERYARPTFIACLDPAEAKGSARSVHGVHMVRALDGAASALRRYGGHAAAAGFSLDAANFARFTELVCSAVAEQLGDASRERVYSVDAVVALGDLTSEVCRMLSVMEPCGQGNAQPLLAALDCEVLGSRAFGVNRDHIGLTLAGPEGGVAEAIAFGKPGLLGHLPRGRRIDCLFAAELDTWQGNERVRLRLRDLRPARSAQLASPAIHPPSRVPVAT